MGARSPSPHTVARAATGPHVRLGDYSRRSWSFVEPKAKHATWCQSQPPMPSGSCDCPRNPTARLIRRLLGEA
jgi:hypothetical protein